MSYDTLQRAVNEAWEAVGSQKLYDLIGGMRAQCQAVIDAKGSYTKF